MTKSTHPTPLDEEKLIQELAADLTPPIPRRKHWRSPDEMTEAVQSQKYILLCKFAKLLIPLIRLDERSKCAEKWISVEERLPENGVKVICSDGRRNVVWADTFIDREWQLEDVPTHWQPLPSPPIEEVKK